VTDPQEVKAEVAETVKAAEASAAVVVVAAAAEVVQVAVVVPPKMNGSPRPSSEDS